VSEEGAWFRQTVGRIKLIDCAGAMCVWNSITALLLSPFVMSFLSTLLRVARFPFRLRAVSPRPHNPASFPSLSSGCQSAECRLSGEPRNMRRRVYVSLGDSVTDMNLLASEVDSRCPSIHAKEALRTEAAAAP
jgi:hypothetical protein